MKLSNVKRGSSVAASPPRSSPRGAACAAAGHGRCGGRGRLGGGRHAFREADLGAAADADVDAADLPVLRPPQRTQPVAVVAAHPIAQEAGRQADRDLVAVDAAERHLAQPGAVLDVADLGLQPAADPGPLRRELGVLKRDSFRHVAAFVRAPWHRVTPPILCGRTAGRQCAFPQTARADHRIFDGTTENSRLPMSNDYDEIGRVAIKI